MKNWSKSANRHKFKTFLDCLVLEVGCPKSSLLEDYSQGLEHLLALAIEKIGVGIYPNDHLTIRQVAESLCTIVQRGRATKKSIPRSCSEIAKEVNIQQSHGGIEQYFPIDETSLVETPERLVEVINALEEHRWVVLTAEPGAGKSWLIECLERCLDGDAEVIKHYCYTSLEDPLSLNRITVNALFGSLVE